MLSAVKKANFHVSSVLYVSCYELLMSVIEQLPNIYSSTLQSNLYIKCNYNRDVAFYLFCTKSHIFMSGFTML